MSVATQKKKKCSRLKKITASLIRSGYTITLHSAGRLGIRLCIIFGRCVKERVSRKHLASTFHMHSVYAPNNFRYFYCT